MIPAPPSNLVDFLSKAERVTVLDWWQGLDDTSRSAIIAFEAPFFPESTVAFPPSDFAESTEAADSADEIDDYHAFLLNHEHKARGPFFSDMLGSKLVIAIPLWSPYWPPYPESFRHRVWRRGGELM